MKQQGFTLIELTLVVVIIGILTSVAIPAYQSNVIRASRGDGMSALLNIMRAQEDYFANEFTYTEDLTELNYDAAHTTASGKYKITASACGGADLINQCVMLTATAQLGQTKDGNLTLDSRGNRTHAGNPGGWPK